MPQPNGSTVDESTPEQLAGYMRVVGMKANPAAQVLVLEVQGPLDLASRKVVMPYAQLYLTSGQLLTQLGEQIAKTMAGRVIG